MTMLATRCRVSIPVILCGRARIALEPCPDRCAFAAMPVTTPEISVLRRELVATRASLQQGVAAAPLRMHVVHVVSVGTEEEVPRVHARRVVTPVANEEVIGQGAVLDQPRDAVRLVGLSSDPERAVTAPVRGGTPSPTRVFAQVPHKAHVDLSPEPAAQRISDFHGR